MTGVISGVQDNLDQRAREFEQRALRQPVFINSAPKSGTHLLRNIVRMFVPPEQHYDQGFIQAPNLPRNLEAFSAPHLSCGHLLFGDESVGVLSRSRHILLVRDPYDWVLSRARFYISDEYQQPNLAHLKSGMIPPEELLNLMILGIFQKAPSLLDIYTWNVVGWLGTRAIAVRYEDIAAAIDSLDSPASETFFTRLLGDCGIDPIPADWRERVRIGADRRQSRTARENLKLAPGIDIPDELPEAQKRLVEFVAPGLRQRLGYS